MTLHRPQIAPSRTGRNSRKLAAISTPYRSKAKPGYIHILYAVTLCNYVDITIGTGIMLSPISNSIMIMISRVNVYIDCTDFMRARDYLTTHPGVYIGIDNIMALMYSWIKTCCILSFQETSGLLSTLNHYYAYQRLQQ